MAGLDVQCRTGKCRYNSRGQQSAFRGIWFCTLNEITISDVRTCLSFVKRDMDIPKE